MYSVFGNVSQNCWQNGKQARPWSYGSYSGLGLHCSDSSVQIFSVFMVLPTVYDHMFIMHLNKQATLKFYLLFLTEIETKTILTPTFIQTESFLKKKSKTD